MIGHISFGIFERKARILAAESQAVSDAAHLKRSRLYLGKGGVIRLEPIPTLLRIECRSGRLWVTQTGSMRDTILKGGDRFESLPHGRVVIEALENACIAQSPKADDSGVLVTHE